MDIREATRTFTACGDDGLACADMLCRIFFREGGMPLLRQLAGLAHNAEAVLSVDVLKGWPEDGLDAFAAFLLALPYRPDQEKRPCGRRENFVAEALSDASVPKSRRIALWRAFVQGGFKFPRYAKGAWSVPRALVDHASVRGWIAATRGEGWSDLRSSDPALFSAQNTKTPTFGSDLERQAWDAIAQDFPAGLMMSLSVLGMKLPLRFLYEVLRAQAAKTLIDLLRIGDCRLSPRNALFYVCANWNNERAIPVVEMLEKQQPGLVATSVDAYGHNALWYTLYTRDSLGKATPAARRAGDPFDVRLVELGCNPAQECFLGFSWQDIVERP